MSNLFKKATSATMALLIVLSIVSPFSGVMAAYSEQEAANKLAGLGVIVDQSANPVNYRLGDSITRGEMAKVTMKLANADVKDVCEGKFKDLTSSNWACKYAELGLSRGYFAANTYFRPQSKITKIEALKMVMKARNIQKADNTDWRAGYVEAGKKAGVLESSFTDYNTIAKRGWIFKIAINAIESDSSSDGTGNDLLDDLLSELDGDDEDTSDDGDTPVVVSGDKVLGVALSPKTPAGATVPGDINGLPVARYTLTAGSEDVTINSLIVKRTGLSDKDTLTGLAAFTEDGRVSKSRNDSQEDDTQATLTTRNFVIKAGETKTLTIVADVNKSTDDDNIKIALGDEFAITLKEILASTPVKVDGELMGSTFRIGGVNAAGLEVRNSSNVSDVTLGETESDIFRFDLTGDSDEDIILKSITFKADDSDAEENFVNFKLYRGTTEVASTKNMNGKYLTFEVENGYTVSSNRVEKFVVKADVVSGAGDEITWSVDKALDVYAVDSKYGYGASIDIEEVNSDGTPNDDHLSKFVIQAGQLTLSDINPESDKIRENKKDAVLAKVKITNVAGKSLELQKFAMEVTLNAGSACIDTNNNDVCDSGENALELKTLFENFELYNEEKGTSYELDLSGNVYQDLDLNMSIPEGVSTFAIRADVKDDIAKFDTASVDLRMNTITETSSDGIFYVVETGDDEQVKDIAPSSLSWKTVKGTESSATVTLSPLSDISKVRGAEGVEAMKFQIEADQSSAIVVDQIKVKVTANGAIATNKEVSQVTLYKGSISEDNVLDRVSGSSIGNDGKATFDGFRSEIAEGGTNEYVVALDFVDGADTVAGSPYVVSVDEADVSVEDMDGYTIDLKTSVHTSSRDITLKDAGKITVGEDSNNDDNLYTKTLLGGATKKVFSIDVQGINEGIDIGQVDIKVNKNIKLAVTKASLYLGDKKIATNSNSDITDETNSVITFKNLDNLVVPQETKELKLELEAATMGFEKVGVTILGLGIESVNFSDMEGADSGKSVADESIASVTSDKLVNIVPAIVTPSVVSKLSSDSTQAKVKVTIDSGLNTVDDSNSSPSVDVNTVTFTTVGATDGITYELYEEGEAAKKVTATSAGGKVEFTLNGSPVNATVTNNKTFVVVPTLGSSETASLILPKDGIDYTVNGVAGASNIKTQSSTELNFGSRTVD